MPRGGTVLVDETLRNKDGISFSHGVEHGFGCQPGYRLIRDATLTCVEGDWYWRVNRKSAEPPLCYRGILITWTLLLTFMLHLPIREKKPCITCVLLS